MAPPVLRLVKGAPLTNAEVDGNFNDLYNDKLDKTGGTMSGALTLNGDPVAGLHAATKQYADNTFVAKAGGTLTGPLILAADPTTGLGAATKTYVDTKAALYLLLTGGALTGALTLAGDPASAMQAATKQYADAVAALRLSLAGGTLIGTLILASDPTTGLGAATKQYVDTRTGLYVPLAGGTMSGALTLAGAPTVGTHAATKAYVDGTVVSVAGTVNQVSVSANTGSVTFSLPQNIHTGAAVQFASFGVGTAASGVGGEIRATNEVTAYYSSDASLKENVVPILGALQKIQQIRGVTFDWKKEVIDARGGEDGFFVRKHDVGIIAQEVQSILPEVVAQREDGTLAVKYEKIVPLLIESIKELRGQVDSLQRQVSLVTARY
jgi:hypothetical protein